jgi:uncharacterized protein (DUF488 family)
LIDVRLNNRSQLAGFTKCRDLEFFLEEICGARYEHRPILSPEKELLDGYKKKTIPWDAYKATFLKLLAARRVEDELDEQSFETPTVLLCSEPTAQHCHRRLVAEYLASKWDNVKIVHL